MKRILSFKQPIKDALSMVLSKNIDVNCREYGGSISAKNFDNTISNIIELFESKKKKLNFEDRFLELIQKGIKIKTLRNSPVELGEYKLNKSLTVEVFAVKKYNSFTLSDYYIHLGQASNSILKFTYYQMGFSNDKEGRAFYEKYFKHDYVYLIEIKEIKQCKELADEKI